MVVDGMEGVVVACLLLGLHGYFPETGRAGTA